MEAISTEGKNSTAYYLRHRASKKGTAISLLLAFMGGTWPRLMNMIKNSTCVSVKSTRHKEEKNRQREGVRHVRSIIVSDGGGTAKHRRAISVCLRWCAFARRSAYQAVNLFHHTSREPPRLIKNWILMEVIFITTSHPVWVSGRTGSTGNNRGTAAFGTLPPTVSLPVKFWSRGAC